MFFILHHHKYFTAQKNSPATAEEFFDFYVRGKLSHLTKIQQRGIIR